MSHKSDCPWKNGWHASVSRDLGEWEYELIVDEEGLYYGVKRITGEFIWERKHHKSEYFRYKFCPMCGVELDAEV